MQACSLQLSRSQKGVAMVEFAITLPLLLFLLLAIGEFGRMLYHYNNLLQANRDAVRYVAGQAWDSNLGRVEIDPVLEGRAKNIAVYGAPSPQNSTVVPGLTTADVQVSTVGTEHVQVRIQYVFQPVIGNGLPALLGDAIPLGIPLVATTVMRGL